jgi:GntR family transcriptional regulator
MSISHHSIVPDRSGFAGIAEALRSEVLRGRLAPGQQLPPISELAGRHHTTAVTVRRALRELEAEGLVRVEHGVGTFVADWGRQDDLLHLPGFAPGPAEGRLETQVLAAREERDSPEARAALGLAAGERLWALERLRRVGGTPVVYQISYVGEALREVVEGLVDGESLYARLARVVGRPPIAADETLDTLPLPVSAAKLLEVEPGTSGWRALRTTLGTAGEPLVYDDAYLPAGRVHLRVRRRAGQALLSFELTDESRR